MDDWGSSRRYFAGAILEGGGRVAKILILAAEQVVLGNTLKKLIRIGAKRPEMLSQLFRCFEVVGMIWNDDNYAQIN